MKWLDHYFKDSNVASGKNPDAIKPNFESFIAKVDIDRWSKERAQEIDKIISTEDYTNALRILKNKSLASIARSVF